MTEVEIIDMWKQGYSVQQITKSSKLVKITKKNPFVVQQMQRKIEKTILKYQS